MKIGLDIQSTNTQATGIGYYTRSLIKEYNNFKGVDFCYYKDQAEGEFNTIRRIYWESITLRRTALKDKVDILHIPGFAGPLLKGKFKKVTTVHDLIGMIYPNNLAPISRFYWQKWLPACVKNSDHIIADSENTKNDIIRLLGLPREKISVIYLAVDKIFKPADRQESKNLLKKNYNIAKPFILNVGTVEPRKNISLLIEAFYEYKRLNKDELILVIVGKKAWDYKRCCDIINKLNISEYVIFCDYVKDTDLPIFYNSAELFIYPSIYEGFGLPVLEAFACGAPVICSNTSSLPEVAGEAGYYINPNSVDDIKRALSDVVKSKGLRVELKEKSLIQAAKFSWKSTAKATLDVYKEVLNGT